MLRSKRVISKVVILSIFAALSACSERSLGGGYKYVKLNYQNHIIANDHGRILVYTNVTFAKKKGKCIIGLRELDEPVGNPPERMKIVDGKYGYFVFNINTGSLRDGLTKEELDRSCCS